MRLLEIHRYPVKSMGGESLAEVEIDGRGLVGDRWFAVVDAEGHLASGKNNRRFRRHDAVFDFAATTGSDGVRVGRADGDESWPVTDPALPERLSGAFGVPVSIRAEDAVPHQDAGQLSLVGTASLAWCAERWGGSPDPRRIRANLVVETDEPFVEDGWVGRQVEIGSSVLRVVGQVPRCRMIDLDQDGVVAGVGWLRPLGQERGTNLAVYADVAEPGRLAIGDEVRLNG
ncbi:MOSC domain-containing protein [Naumannella sp. ID2617S]|nr:MOSC domain-containing protein [Naumannella sp. ID2617S]